MGGRPQSRKMIVEQFMDCQEIVVEKCKLLSLFKETENTEQSIQWLAKRGLIKNSCLCGVCEKPASLLKFGSGIDGVRWGCNTCNFRRSIRSKSFFERSKLPLGKIILFVYCWCTGLPTNIIFDELDISMKTLIDWCNFCREECTQWFDTNTNQIGGMNENFQPITVEIHCNFHVGKHLPGRWVFGGIERRENGNIGKCFLVGLPDNSASTLQEEILRHILPGTHIISGGLATFENIPLIGDGIYTHSFLVHQNNFVDPNDSELHTQNVKNMWMRAKRKLKHQFGTSDYMHEFVFRNSFRSSGNVFGVFLTVIRKNYGF